MPLQRNCALLEPAATRYAALSPERRELLNAADLVRLSKHPLERLDYATVSVRTGPGENDFTIVFAGLTKKAEQKRDALLIAFRLLSQSFGPDDCPLCNIRAGNFIFEKKGATV
jgi:hypothetical protein